MTFVLRSELYHSCKQVYWHFFSHLKQNAAISILEIPQGSNSCRNITPVIKCVIKKLMLCQWRYHLKTKTLTKKLRFIMKTVKSFKLLLLTSNAWRNLLMAPLRLHILWYSFMMGCVIAPLRVHILWYIILCWATSKLVWSCLIINGQFCFVNFIDTVHLRPSHLKLWRDFYLQYHYLQNKWD